MTKPSSKPTPSGTSRRDFLRTSSLVAAASIAPLARAESVHTGGSDTLRIGLVGCGGRGTTAVLNALQADPHVQVTALADAFADRIEHSLSEIQADPLSEGKVDVPPERRFVGFDAYQELIDSGVDVVLLATPPHFRPQHLKAAVDAGKHIFCEKPVAVDAPGVRSVLETCRVAKEKNLSVVSGLCLRYHGGFVEAIRRIHDGAIGDVHTLFANDYRGAIWVKTRKPDWTDMHWQMRNWYYYTWLSGDFNVEQHIHYLDVCAWVKGAYPTKALGVGGRQARTGEQHGNIYDHHSVQYEYDDGTRLISNCRQQDNVPSDVRCIVQGSQGSAEMAGSRLKIRAADTWRHREKVKNMYDVEHDRLFEAIRLGEAINDGEHMAHSTLLAIMGRMATYTGQVVSWDDAMASSEDLTPNAYAWGPAPEVKIAIPGVTELT